MPNGLTMFVRVKSTFTWHINWVKRKMPNWILFTLNIHARFHTHKTQHRNKSPQKTNTHKKSNHKKKKNEIWHSEKSFSPITHTPLFNKHTCLWKILKVSKIKFTWEAPTSRKISLLCQDIVVIKLWPCKNSCHPRPYCSALCKSLRFLWTRTSDTHLIAGRRMRMRMRMDGWMDGMDGEFMTDITRVLTMTMSGHDF